MLSKILIDIDNDNQPVVKIEYRYSEDVRDKMVKRFMETLENDSWFCSFNYQSHSDNGPTVALIRPLPVREFKYHVNEMVSMHERYEKQQPQIASPISPAEDERPTN